MAACTELTLDDGGLILILIADIIVSLVGIFSKSEPP